MQQGNFQYLITAKFDAAGAEAAKKSLKAAAAEATAGSEASAKASGKAEEAQEKVTASTKKLTAGQRGLKDAIRGVALQFPILGRFAEAAINPIIGGIGLAVTAATAIVLRMRELRKTLEDVIKVDAPAEFMRLAQAAQDAELSSAKYARELERVQSANQSIADSTNEIVQALQARNVAEAEIDDAQKALALARVNEAEKTGILKSTTAIQQRAAIEDAAAKRRVDRENQTAQAIIAARQAELDGTRKAIAETQSELQRITGQQARLGTEDNLTGTIDRETARKTELAKQLKSRESAMAGFRATGGFGAGYLVDSDLAKQIASDKKQLAAISADLAELRASEREVRQQIQATAESRSETEARLKELTAREVTLGRDIPKLTTQAAATATQRSTLFGLESQRRQVDTSAATAVPVTAADQAQAGQIIQSAEDSPSGSILDNITAQLLQDGKQVDKGLLQAIEKMSRIMGRFVITVEMLNNRLKEMDSDTNRKLLYRE